MNIYKIAIICFFIYLAALLVSRIFYLQTLVTTSVPIASTTGSSSANYGYIIYVVVILVIFSALAIKFGGKRHILTKIVAAYYFLFVILATFILVTTFTATLPVILGDSLIIIAVIAIGALYWKKRIECFNLFGVIIAITIPLFLAFDLNLLTVIILLVVLAVYDFIAVFITKHMQLLAKMSFGDTPIPTMLVFGKYSDIKDSMNSTVCRNCRSFMNKKGRDENHFVCPNCNREVKIVDKKIQVIKEGNLKAPKKEKSTFALGLGDLILPAIFPIAIMLKFGMLKALIVIVGATVGVVLNMYIVKKLNRGLPALPLIVAMMLLFALI